MKPTWLLEAEKYIGLKEIPGLKHESKILNFWQVIKMGGIKDDETPWCAAFVGAMLEASRITSTESGWAKSYLKWGVLLTKPALGCIVVFDRAGGGGHVGFVVGLTTDGRINVLGGNQEDGVNIKPFPLTRVLGYRWPKGYSIPMLTLSEVDNNEVSSTNEA
jgi:uncharacterized protein (TIGR02594 family)